MRAGFGLAVMLCCSRAASAGWDDGPACATTPEGCELPAPPVAKVATGPSEFERTPVLVNLHLGIATPYGGAGLALDVSPLSWFSIEAGGGVSTSGPQAALMPRIRGLVGRERRMAVGFGTGVSVGRHVAGSSGNGLFAALSANDHSPPDTKIWDTAWWHNVEVGWERRPRRSGVALRAYGGVAFLRNPDEYRCEEYLGYGCEPNQGEVLMYGGIALGVGL